MKAIFGEKAGNVKDASKRCTSGVNGIVIETQLFERKNRAMLDQEKQEIRKIQKEARQERLELIQKRNELLSNQLISQVCGGMRDIATDKTVVKAKTLLTKNRVKSLEFDSISLKSPWVEDFSAWNRILTIWKNYKRNLKQLEEDISTVKIDGKDVPVKLRVFDSIYVPLAKWSMLLTGNYRCITRSEPRSICDAVHSDLSKSQSIYEFVDKLAQRLGADPSDAVPFEKYANAAESLLNPSSAARSVAAGAPFIERVDVLVQLIARDLGLSNAHIDETVKIVDEQLEANVL